MPRRLAVIPARGGSKRIPGKNVREFCGKPMIGHILDAARESGLFDVIHVSTDSAEVSAVVDRQGSSVDFLRPKSLADDHTPLMPVLRFVAEEYERRGEVFDEIWLLMACAPFVEPEQLRSAARMLADSGGVDPVIAVSQYPVPVEWAYRLGADGRLTPVQPGMFAVRSQDIEPAYFDTGAFVGFPASFVRSSEGAGTDGRYIGYVMKKGSTIDIDDDADWEMAAVMFTARRHQPRGGPGD